MQMRASCRHSFATANLIPIASQMSSVLLSIKKSTLGHPDSSVSNNSVMDDLPITHGSICLARRDASLVQIDIPLISTQQLYYRREGAELLLASDVRQLFRRGDKLDDMAIYALLQFGAIVPPRSPWNGVTRFVPGKAYELDLNSTNIREVSSNIAFHAERPTSGLDVTSMAEHLIRELDRVLVESCPNQDPIILFSGGVDSGVLASRAVALGWKKATLANYSLGPDDVESVLAEQMAGQLGLEFVRIEATRSLDYAFLSELAAAYSAPFGDYSALPTYRLSRAVQQRFASNRVVIDGTGADAAFGLFAKAAAGRRLYRVPPLIRRLFAAPYALDRIWLHPSRIEFLSRICRRSIQMNAPAASIARNPLRDIAFQFGQEQYRSVAADLESWLDSTGLPKGLDFRLPAIDLILGTANIFAQKNATLFDSADRKIVYPFMDPRIALLGLSSDLWIRINQSPKAVLKKILADVVPREMVYRRKSGFTVPAAEYFSAPSFVAIFDEALESDITMGQTSSVLRNLRKIRDRLAARSPMPEHMYHLVWTIVFFHLWLAACSRQPFAATRQSG